MRQVLGARAAKLRDRLDRRLVLADGSTGSALAAMAPEWATRLALLPLERPDFLESLHGAYFGAGSELVETATFQASAAGLAPLLGAEADPFDAAWRVNLAAAAGDAGVTRWVAGSIGPGDSPPSFGVSTWEGLKASYLPQARGLFEGGCDLAIIETCQDPLQVKAAIAALMDPAGGRGLPFIVSATVDARGRLLAGTSIAAFVAIIGPFGPLAIGLNCSGGPEELGPVLAELSRVSPFPVCFMPNAGLPHEEGGRTVWPLDADAFAAQVDGLARKYGVSMAGGCCGTGPAHIAALRARLDDRQGEGAAPGSGERPVPAPRPAARPALASLYEARPFGPGLFRIGERANAAGSAAFAALIQAGDMEGAADKAVEQEAAGAAALDLRVARRGRDEAADLSALVGRLSILAKSALSLDSSDPEVLKAALPLVSGRPLINSTSLEDPAKARRVFSLAEDFGAAVVCLAMDGAGPAKTAEDKARACRALYDIATVEYGLSPSSLLFEPLTFTVAAGPAGAAAETLRAIPLIKAACPGALTVLGVGNVSYGLPRPVRPAVTAVFLGLAVEAGLDAAIVDCGLPELSSVEPPVLKAARFLVEGRRAEDYDPLAVLLEAGERGQGRAPGAGVDEE